MQKHGSPPPQEDAWRILTARGLRGFADGLVSLVLPAYLAALGYDAVVIGALATATLLGSAGLTLTIGLIAHRWPTRALLIGMAMLMTLTGIGFAGVEELAPLFLLAVIGTLNPSAGDVSAILPLEQARLSQSATAENRTALFARYSFVGTLTAALGALAAALPEAAAGILGWPIEQALKAAFLLYAVIGVVVAVIYRGLAPAPAAAGAPPSAPLSRSRGIVLRLAALFSLDSFGGGFLVQSLLALWLFERFGLSLAAAGAFFFWTGLLSAFSYFAAVPLARRIGLVETMVFTHLPANICLVIAPFCPALWQVLALLTVRSALSQMDVPARSSYVMAVVAPEERAAAAAVTNVPRSLASAASPALAGWLLALGPFGWPLVIGGGLKIVYDLLLLALFKRHRPPEERGGD